MIFLVAAIGAVIYGFVYLVFYGLWCLAKDLVHLVRDATRP